MIDNKVFLLPYNLGEAADQDEAFWNAEVWKESDDESFSEVEAEPDVFDSDFNETEDDDEESSGDEKSIKRVIRLEVNSLSNSKIYIQDCQSNCFLFIL